MTDGHGAQPGGHRTGTFVLGTTGDGIDILKPRGSMTNFTWSELRAAVDGAKRNAHR